MTVQDLMTSQVQTCRSEDSLTQAARIMWESDCGCVPVINDQSEVVGMVTDRDICMAAYTQDRRLGEIPVKAVMARRVHSVKAKDDLGMAEQVMQRNAIRRVPVIEEDGRIVGILSMSDLARAAVRRKGQENVEVTTVDLAKTLAAVSQPRGIPALGAASMSSIRGGLLRDGRPGA